MANGPDYTQPPWPKVAEAARARWGRATPYRLGYLVGLRNIQIANPYEGSRSGQNYTAGVLQGQRERKVYHA